MKSGVEEQLQQLRSKATELLFKEDYKQYINLYSHFISLLCNQRHEISNDVNKSLSLALSNRAEAHYKLRDFSSALKDCNEALQIDPSHQKTLICKGKTLLELDRYSQAKECFQSALSFNKSETLIELLEKCKKLDAISKSGQIDISDWLLNGFNGKFPELAEFIGSVEIRIDNGRRGLYATKNIDAGTTLITTKAVVLGRGILPDTGFGAGENARMVMWKDFVDRILDATEKCSRTLNLIYLLSMGGNEEENSLKIPDMELFKPEAEEERFYLENKEPDVKNILKVLDVNCLNEEAISSKVLANKTSSNYCGVGLWILPSFVNHSCSPNARRLHIGDWMVMHASRDLKAGEEITFAYFDVLLPLYKRKELCKRWGFDCECKRCEFEEKEQMRDVEINFVNGYDLEKLVLKLEEQMRRSMIGRKEKGFIRASFWEAYFKVYESEKIMKRLGSKVPKELVLAENLMDAIGGDERILKLVLDSLKKNGSGCGSRVADLEKIMKMGRGVYGKVVKKQGMRALSQLLNC